MLWAYALVFSLYLIIGNNTAELKKVFRIALAFALIMEVLQLTPLVKGTFDVADIMLEYLAEVTAVTVIKIISLRRSY
ncbi:MAG: hypothetical protein KBS83_05100 [Lachnospiraceae bacterium]|nr:hypothetical protein [Candidatus Equihabitans merdae]